MSMIAPHGGKLKTANTNLNSFNQSKRIQVDMWTLNDAMMLAEGAYSPLDSFMNSKELQSVHSTSMLPDGTLWTIPILFRTNENIQPGEDVVLVYDQIEFAVLHAESIFSLENPDIICKDIFKTYSSKHPGVKLFMSKPNNAVSGKVYKITSIPRKDINDKFIMSPAAVRQVFESKNWQTIAGFQTRNPIHRGHEFIQKMTLSFVDGVFINPLIGDTKDDDIPADIRFKCYDQLTQNYYNPDHYHLSALVANMNYAGPKEAVHHGIIRQNFGCTHLIVGRDHAGVGDFYTPYEAQEFYESLSHLLEINMVKFNEVFYCETCGNHSTEKMCAHNNKTDISGTVIRNSIINGIAPNEKLLRKDISDILISYYSKTL